jgi:hypothetical protein
MASCDLCAERCKYTPTKRQMTVGGSLVFVCDDHMDQIMKRQDDAIREMDNEPRGNNADLQQARWVDAKKGNPFTYG